MFSEIFMCKVSEKHIEKHSLNSPNAWSLVKSLIIIKKIIIMYMISYKHRAYKTQYSLPEIEMHKLKDYKHSGLYIW